MTASALYPSLYEFLAAQGLKKTANALLAEASLGSKPEPADPEVMSELKALGATLAGKRKREEGNGKKAAADSDGEHPPGAQLPTLTSTTYIHGLDPVCTCRMCR